MKTKYVRWLLDELDDLAAREILTEQAVRRLRDHYAPALDRRGRTRELVLGVLGTVLVSGGVVLLLAHNWEELDRPLRTVLSFLPLLVAQALVFFTAARRRESTVWREASATALSLALLSSISLVGQTYQLPGSFADLLLTCSVLTLPVVYLLDAAVPAALYLMAIAGWLAESSPASETVPADLGYWLLLGPVVPFLVSLWRREPSSGRTLLAEWALAGSLLVAAGAAFDGLGRGVWPSVMAVVASLLALEGSRLAPGLAWRKSPLRIVGTLGVFGLGLFASSADGLRELGRPEPSEAGIVGNALWLLLALGLARVAVLGLRALREGRPAPFLVGLFPFLVALANLGRIAVGFPTLALVVFNLFLAAWTLTGLARGLRNGRAGAVHLNLLGFATLLVFRFFESDLSLVARGLGFVVIGIGFLLVNAHLSRRLKQTQGATS